MATKWTLDASHSEVQFKVKHLMITNVTGTIKAIEGAINSEDDNFENVKVSFKADLSSIDTGSEQRDAHLKSADFFDVEKFATITFESTTFKVSDEKIKGKLSIKGVSKEVEFAVEFAGMNKDPWGNEKAGFSVSGKINRTDFGLNWNAQLETGGVLVSEEVKLVAELQFVKG